MKKLVYIIIGTVFGYTLVESQVISWYRIQEMFLFDSIHMYGVIGTAILTAMVLLQIAQRFSPDLKSKMKQRPFNKGTIIGGLLFGLGWSITGACPGPIYALIGSTAWIYGIVMISAIAGVILYGYTLTDD